MLSQTRTSRAFAMGYGTFIGPHLASNPQIPVDSKGSLFASNDLSPRRELSLCRGLQTGRKTNGYEDIQCLGVCSYDDFYGGEGMYASLPDCARILRTLPLLNWV